MIKINLHEICDFKRFRDSELVKCSGSVVGKFIVFDLLWCVQTTFTSLSKPELYINSIFLGLLLTLPYIITRSRKVHIGILILLDALLVANLMYNRTYNSPIPLDNYYRTSNLSDFGASVTDQMRWYDVFLPLETLLYLVYCVRHAKGLWNREEIKCYVKATTVFGILSILLILLKGGLGEAFDKLQTKNDYTCAAPIYTPIGCILHDALQQDEEITPVQKHEIDCWLKARPAWESLPDSVQGERKNLVIVFCESLESFVFERKIEGKEIMPCLNKELRDKSTLFAPLVLTQVKGGRSIDGQLILLSGLLPIENGSYSFVYPNHTFPSLLKALKEKDKAKGWLLTVDKPIIWNQGVIARRMGIDEMLCKKDWRKSSEAIGPRKNLPDGEFIDQCIERMKAGKVWKDGQSGYVQMVTYSGHSPFKLPQELDRLHLKKEYPDKMKDYLTTANYTDHALGKLLAYLKSRKDWKQTMVVIVGDHEGLASDREALCESEQGQGVISPKPFTPFIVLNSPVAGRYNGVLGQIDQYPTILELMRLDKYSWKGLGESILHRRKYPVAVGSDMNVEGSGNARIIRYLKKAYQVSNDIIQFDYLK